MKCLLPLLLVTSAAMAQQPSIADLKAGRYTADTSHVYLLPYPRGKSYLLAQAYDSKLSHKGEFALDFKMKPGTRICAAREGVVVALREDSDRGGLKPEFLSEGNFIIVRHYDGSSANYWHLQQNGVLVEPGDTVRAGHVIGLSGNTGYSAFPHLHFEVTPPPGSSAVQIPTRFRTRKGIRYLRPLKWHKAD